MTDPVYTPAQIATEIEVINNMSHESMCRLWRFAPSGHPFFNSSLPFYNVFKARMDALGGFTPEISKSLGWKDSNA